jgi:hypothetical protein
VLGDFLFGKAGIYAVDEKTFSATDAGQHPRYEICVIAIVIVGVGKNIDQDIRGLQSFLGNFPIGITPPGTGIKVGSIQKYQVSEL